MTVQVKSSLRAISPYKQGSASVAGGMKMIKLSSNELPYPPSPKALAAYGAVQTELGRYPDGSQTGLRAAIAALHDIHATNIFCGNGSEEAIGLIIRTIIAAGDEMVISENSFLMAEIYARSVGGIIVKCVEQDHRVDVDAMLAAITPLTRIVYICTPNNPTGTYTTRAELHRLAAGIPDGVLLIVDAAYSEFVTATDYDCGLKSLFKPQGNVVVTRTFSKAYGLAGLRIGWAAVPDAVADGVARLRTPFNANSAALAAAEAAIRDQDHLHRSVAAVNATRETFCAGLRGLGLSVVPSQANFVLIVFAPGGDDATQLDSALKAKGILGRPVSGHANEYRLSIGTDVDMDQTLEAIRLWWLAATG